MTDRQIYIWFNLSFPHVISYWRLYWFRLGFATHMCFPHAMPGRLDDIATGFTFYNTEFDVTCFSTYKFVISNGSEESFAWDQEIFVSTYRAGPKFPCILRYLDLSIGRWLKLLIGGYLQDVWKISCSEKKYKTWFFAAFKM